MTKNRSSRLRRLDRVFAGMGDYFLTICCEDRTGNTLAVESVHARVRLFFDESPGRYFVHVPCYVVMPDHVHCIAALDPHRCEIGIGEWVKAFKAVVSRREFQWQTGFFDHVLRSDESAGEKWEYIRMNPVRAGLVKRWEDWPFSGFAELD